MTLSSAKAEYIALPEAAKEIRFVYQLLVTMNIKVTLPIVVRVDNVGAIFMSENASTNGRTRHIDIRYHYVREFIEEGFLKIIFVKTKDNLADGFTKNITGELYGKHSNEYLSDMPTSGKSD